jgi:Putative peptidoglycan binding domain.
MRKIILSLIWVVVAAMPTLNAQQVSPSQPTTAQQPSKPKATGTRPFPQPRVQPTQAIRANNNPRPDRRIPNNPGHGKPVANNPGNGKPGVDNPGNGKPADNNPGNGNTIDNNFGHGKTPKDNHDNYADAKRRYRHERHDCDWWKQHYIAIVLVGGGYYYRDSGYWYPAWGYNPNYERYEYDGPIYTYGNLLPDQVIINVQSALKALGYYAGNLSGSLGVDTRQALTVYQQDYGLDATGTVDEATVRALGLI